jgi:serine/threonine protein kinase
MSISLKHMPQMSQLLDEALELDDMGRREWLDALAAGHRQLEDALQRALVPREGGSAGVSTQPRLDAAAGALEPGKRVGPYQLLRRLGAGGMAQVWLAQRADGAFRRAVALKVPMQCRLGRDLASRFARECDILAGLEHPNIARLYDAGATVDGHHYLAMEYVDGESLIRWCDAHHLTVRERLALFLQVLDAVQYAHRRQVIHRDIKPSNILVTDCGQVRLLDFGAAKLLAPDEPQQTDLTRIYGRALTPAYASPELLRGDDVNVATDVYALGIVLHELLAGIRPAQAHVPMPWRAAAAALAPHVQRASTQVGPDAAAARATTQRRLARKLRGDLDAIVLRALAGRPEHRYGSAVALAHDLRRHLSRAPVHARPDRPFYRFAKFVLRHPRAVAILAALSVILLVAIGYALMRPVGAGPIEAPANSNEAWSQTGDRKPVDRFCRLLLALQRSPEQKARLVPVALDGAFSDAKGLGDLGLGVATVVAHLDQLREPRLGLLQHQQGLMNVQDRLLAAGQMVQQLG